MQIIDVEFLNKPIVGDNGLVEAVLNMDTDKGVINIAVKAVVGDDIVNPELRKCLVYDGVRQLGRMPGYRCGTKQVVLSEQALANIN